MATAWGTRSVSPADNQYTAEDSKKPPLHGKHSGNDGLPRSEEDKEGVFLDNKDQGTQI